MTYKNSYRPVLVGKFDTGSTVTIKIRDLNAQTLLTLSSNTCAESTDLPGWFEFDTSNVTDMPTTEVECLCVMSDGTNEFGNKIKLGGYPDTIDTLIPDLLNTEVHTYTTTGTVGCAINDTRYLQHRIYVDTEANENGDGTQHSPFDNFLDAKNEAESRGIHNIVIAGEAVLSSSLKNFTIIGIGTPNIDLNGQDCKNTSFYQCKLSGSHVNTLIARECVLDDITLHGYYSNCILLDASITAKSDTISFLYKCACGSESNTPSTISFSGVSNSALNIQSFSGRIELTDCTDASNSIMVDAAQGGLIIANSNTAGNFIVCGPVKLENYASGITLHDYTMYKDTIAEEAWGYTTRTLTETIEVDGPSLHSGLDSYTGKDDWKTDSSDVADAVWSKELP